MRLTAVCFALRLIFSYSIFCFVDLEPVRIPWLPLDHSYRFVLQFYYFWKDQSCVMM